MDQDEVWRLQDPRKITVRREVRRCPGSQAQGLQHAFLSFSSISLSIPCILWGPREDWTLRGGTCWRCRFPHCPRGLRFGERCLMLGRPDALWASTLPPRRNPGPCRRGCREDSTGWRMRRRRRLQQEGARDPTEGKGRFCQTEDDGGSQNEGEPPEERRGGDGPK